MNDSVGGSQSYTYDGLNRQVSTRTSPTSTPVTVTYSPAGDTTSYTDNGGTVTYAYDAGHELVTLAEPGGSCTGTVSGCTTFYYNDNGARVSTLYPGGIQQSRRLDDSGRIVGILAQKPRSVPVTQLNYSYTGAGADRSLVQTRTANISTTPATVPDGAVTTYGYDTLARLTSATERTNASAPTITADWFYTYDNDGNRTSNYEGVQRHPRGLGL